MVTERTIAMVSGLLIVLVQISAGIIIKVLPVNSEDDESEAVELLNEGCELYDSGDMDGAIRKWRVIYDDYKGTDVFFMALYNLGLAYIAKTNYERAISYFKELLESDADDKDEGGSIMETNRNYHHKACLELSFCYEKKGDTKKALEYLYLARNKYPLYSWCGTCSMLEEKQLSDRISYFEAKLKWKADRNYDSFFYLFVHIKTPDTNRYNISFPMPCIIINKAEVWDPEVETVYIPSPAIAGLMFKVGPEGYTIRNEDRGTWLDITASGECVFEIKYKVPRWSSDDRDLFDSLSGLDLSYLSLPYTSLIGGREWVSLTFDLRWTMFEPDVEYAFVDINDQIADQNNPGFLRVWTDYCT